MLSSRIVVGIDVGNLISGVVVLIDGEIAFVEIMENTAVFFTLVRCLDKYRDVDCIIEDIKPYAGGLTQQAIDTCKFIGQLTWRLKEVNARFCLCTRSTVRKWVYDTAPELVLPLVIRKIEKRNAKKKDGANRRPSFVYIDDSMILKTMKKLWSIPDPPPGKGYVHGLKLHTWSALALASYFSWKEQAFGSEFLQILPPPSVFFPINT